MKEKRYDGDEMLTEKATLENFDRAIHDPRNKSVEMHGPGSKFKSKGKEYITQGDGTLARTHAKKKERRAKNKRARKARRKNR